MFKKDKTNRKHTLLNLFLIGTISFCSSYPYQIMANNKLPSQYGSTSKITKNQLPWGTCWAFAGTGAMEYTADHKEGGDHIFSEESMLRSFAKNSNTGWQLTKKDSGGNSNMAAGYLATYGSVSSDLPYDKKNALLFPLSQDDSFVSHYRATDIKYFQPKYNSDESLTNETINQIKEAIYQNGSVDASIFWNRLYIKKDALNNQLKNSREQNNHDIVIIGWDDQYDHSHFTRAKHDGAFLVQNSWGNNDGNHGYFWVSYDDKSLTPNFTIQNYQKTECNENYYHLEEGALAQNVKTINAKGSGYLNVFSLKGKEQLKSVTFYSSSIGMKCQLYYVPLDKSENPDISNMKAISAEDTIDYEGYHTKKIEQSIIKNEKVAIMVVIKAKDDTTSFGAEGRTISGFYNTSLAKGESYLVTANGIEDIYKRNFGNWAIRLTTEDANEAAITSDRSIKEIQNNQLAKASLGLKKITKLVLDDDRNVYNSKNKTPEIEVYAKKDYLEQGKDYIVKYKNNKQIGQGQIIVVGKNLCFGKATKKFWIHPDKVRSLKIKRKGNVTKIHFKRNKGRVSGYRIQYSTSRKMKHSKFLTTKKNHYKIESKKKLYVEVKAYKVVGKRKVYSLK